MFPVRSGERINGLQDRVRIVRLQIAIVTVIHRFIRVRRACPSNTVHDLLGERLAKVIAQRKIRVDQSFIVHLIQQSVAFFASRLQPAGNRIQILIRNFVPFPERVDQRHHMKHVDVAVRDNLASCLAGILLFKGAHGIHELLRRLRKRKI
ncbi:hypothetical protein D3C81_1369680 [compost metagenome]